MTIRGYGPSMADLAPTQDELDALYDVLAELDQAEAAGYGYGDPDADDLDGYDGDPEAGLANLGPGYPATSAQLAYELDETYGIDLAGDADPLELIAAGQTARMLELARQDQDAEDAERAAGPRQRRYSGEERLARALDRIEAGTYTSPTPGYAAAELSNASGNCGPTDAATGLCASPFHQLDCTSAHVSSPATGDQDEMDAWRAVVLAHSGREVSAIDLATRTGPDFDDLLESPEPADSATYYELRKILGISRKPGPVYRRAAPAITRQELGI